MTPVSNRHPFLASAGRITRHSYVRTDAVRCLGAGKKEQPIGYEHIFKCDETGVERRWGLDAQAPTGWTGK